MLVYGWFKRNHGWFYGYEIDVGSNGMIKNVSSRLLKNEYTLLSCRFSVFTTGKQMTKLWISEFMQTSFSRYTEVSPSVSITLKTQLLDVTATWFETLNKIINYYITENIINLY